MDVNGERTDSETGSCFSVLSPTTGEEMGRFPQGTREDLRRAVDAIQDAQEVAASLTVLEREKLAFRIGEETAKGAEGVLGTRPQTIYNA